jgi:hypothetical protein
MDNFKLLWEGTAVHGHGRRFQSCENRWSNYLDSKVLLLVKVL